MVTLLVHGIEGRERGIKFGGSRRHRKSKDGMTGKRLEDNVLLKFCCPDTIVGYFNAGR